MLGDPLSLGPLASLPGRGEGDQPSLIRLDYLHRYTLFGKFMFKAFLHSCTLFYAGILKAGESVSHGGGHVL